MTTWLVDARTLSTKPTGVGLYAFRLLKKHVAEESDARFVLVSDVAESAELRELERLGCEIRTYGRRVYRSWAVVGYFRWVKRQAADVRPDVFWQPNNLQPFRPHGVGRVIVTVHDVFGLRGWTWRCLVWHVYYAFCFWRTLRCVTEIWYNSGVTKRQVEALRFAGRRARALANRVTYPIAEVPPGDEIGPWKWPHPFFLYLGNVETRKGADILVEAFRRYRAGGGTHDLVVAGLERNVPVPDELGFVKLGYVDDATKFALMKSCAAFVVPSRDEGYGMQLAEALKLGVRTIASDVPVFAEVVAGQGSLFQDVRWLKGFAAGTDDARVALLSAAMADAARTGGEACA